MENLNEIVKLNDIIKIHGNWRDEKEPIWVGEVLSEEQVFLLSLIDNGNKIIWQKSERNPLVPKISIHLFNYYSDKYDVCIGLGYGMSFNGILSHKKSKNYLPNIFTGEIKAGNKFLLCEFDGKPKINIYGIFFPKRIIKRGRCGLWHIKEKYINETNEIFINKIKYGRKGLL